MAHEHADESQRDGNLVSLRAVFEAWFSEHREPKHVAIAGKTYDGFARNCYQFILSRIAQQGEPSSDALIDNEERKQVEAFLAKAKARWDIRLLEKRDKADELRKPEGMRWGEELVGQRPAEERSQVGRPRQSDEQIKAARMLQDKEQRLADTRNVDSSEKQRLNALHRGGDSQPGEYHPAVTQTSQQDTQRKASAAVHIDESLRIEQILSSHRQAAGRERLRLQEGLCCPSEYYSFVLRNRVERSAELLFGSAVHPSYSILERNPELIGKLKGLSFGDNRHPDGYQDCYVNAYYTLRYELGYAFEYSQIYGLLLDIALQQHEGPYFDILSIGSGQGLDYWGLRYALSSRDASRLFIGWRGVDSEIWPDHILEDGTAEYSDGIDVRSVLGTIDELESKVLMFPKVISELSIDDIAFIAAWLERVAFTRNVHYLCIAHTERKSLDPADSKHKGANDRFDGIAEPSLDAVKSAQLIKAAYDSACRQSYRFESQWHYPDAMSVRSYSVDWPSSQSGKVSSCQYQYLVYNDDGGGNDWCVWRNDATFFLDEHLRNAVKGIGSSCCPKFMPFQEWGYGGRSTDCDTRRASCDNSFLCPLHKYPRYKTGGIAYQIVRLVKHRSDGSAFSPRRSSYSFYEDCIPF